MPGTHLKDMGQWSLAVLKPLVALQKNSTRLPMMVLQWDMTACCIVTARSIADSVEYMVNAHCRCICLHFKLRQDHTRNVNGSNAFEYTCCFCVGWSDGSGQTKLSDQIIKLDLVDATVAAANPNVSDEDRIKLNVRHVQPVVLVPVCLPRIP